MDVYNSAFYVPMTSLTYDINIAITTKCLYFEMSLLHNTCRVLSP